MGRKKTIDKEPVTIRFKELANGNKSIYLDIYMDGKRSYEFLKLYLIPEVGRERAKARAKAAGIKKNISFHTARHTFATMMLTLGADIYTTSKLLGHSRISTTEIYAKIVDKKKDEAMGLIDKFFDKE